jgi:hypothetical protein
MTQMNPQAQSNPSKPFESVTVAATEDDNITVSVESPDGKPVVCLHEHGLFCFNLTPRAATRLAQVLLQAAESAGDPAAFRMFEVLREYVARHNPGEDDELYDDEDISPEDRLAAAAGMEKLVAEMRAAGAATLGELFAMKQEAANKANADGAAL